MEKGEISCIDTTDNNREFSVRPNLITRDLEKGLEDLRESDLKEMLTVANAAASIITTRKGALKVMPAEEEIQRLIFPCR